MAAVFAFRWVPFTMVLLWFTISGFAQPSSPKTRSLGLILGNSNFHGRDLLLSPLIYRGNNIGGELFYKSSGMRAVHDVKLAGAGGEITANVTDFPMTGIRAELSYAYLHQLDSIQIKKSRHPIQVGAILRVFMNIEGSEEFEVISWLIAYSLNAAASMEFKINGRNTVSWQVHFPLFAMVHRPPYARADERLTESDNPFAVAISRYGEPAVLFEYLMVGSELTYQYELSTKWNLVAKQGFQYHGFKSPDRIKMFTNTISAGFSIKL